MATSKARRTTSGSKPPKPSARSKPRAKADVTARPGAEAKRANAKAASPPAGAGIGSRGNWHAETLAEVRRLILAADPDIVEERKWKKPTNPDGVPTWSHAGIVCTGETYKQMVKLTFARGASLSDPQGLFNSSLDGNTRRAIDIREGEQLDAKAFQALIQAAVAENLRLQAPKATTPKTPAPKTAASKSSAAKTPAPKRSMKKAAKPQSSSGSMTTATDRNGKKVTLLSGGNPQIAKADGDAPVQAYIAAMPGWKHDLGQRLDALIEQAAPQVRKAVKWNSPFYGIEGQGWFATFHVFTRYVKMTFFRGASLQPIPPGSGKDKDARWIDLYEDDELDEAQFTRWVKQAAAIPGWTP